MELRFQGVVAIVPEGISPPIHQALPRYHRAPLINLIRYWKKDCVISYFAWEMTAQMSTCLNTSRKLWIIKESQKEHLAPNLGLLAHFLSYHLMIQFPQQSAEHQKRAYLLAQLVSKAPMLNGTFPIILSSKASN